MLYSIILKIINLFVSFFILLFLFNARTVSACTTFLKSEETDVFFGKSYDWFMEQGLLFINKRGVEKRAFLRSLYLKPATWTSRFASITFNQYGREFPNGGMNEAGLGIEISQLDSDFPSSAANKVVNELQWIQYELDNYMSVQEMIAHKDELTIVPILGNVHFLACDKTSQCAVFEYQNEKLVTVSGAGMPVPVLANSLYANSISELSLYNGFGGTQAIPTDSGTYGRFVRASSLLRKSMRGLQAGFEILESVATPGMNAWQILYNLRSGTVYFRTSEHTAIKSVDFSIFEKSCSTPVMVANIAQASQGDITQSFKPYSDMENHALVRESFEKTFGHFPKGELEFLIKRIADVPSSYRCAFSLPR